MKRIFTVVKNFLQLTAIVGITLILFHNTANADVIFEPSDSFYSKHSSDCTRSERYYIANGYNGKVIVYKSPEKNKVAAEYENGQKMWVNVIYTDKGEISWGLIDGTGWFPLDYAYPVYDSLSFTQAYMDSFEYVSGDAAKSGIVKDEEFYIYSYPGAENGYKYTCYDEEGPYIDTIYTDPFGNRWGYVSYYYANRGWICLSNPGYSFAELYPNGQSFSGVMEIPDECAVEIVPGKKNGNDNKDKDKDKENNKDKNNGENKDNDSEASEFPWIWVIIGAVILVSVCAAVIIIVVIKKNASGKNQ